MLRRKKAPHSQGFTLVEVLVSLVVLMIGMLGLISMVRTAFSGSTISRRANEAAVLAEQQLEAMRTVPLAPGTTFTDVVDGRGLPNTEGPFTRTATVVQTTTPVLGTMLVVTVNVGYEIDGEPHNVTVYTERLP